MIPYTHEQMLAIVDEIGKQTDRGAAIIAAAVIEDVLEHLIIARTRRTPLQAQKGAVRLVKRSTIKFVI